MTCNRNILQVGSRPIFRWLAVSAVVIGLLVSTVSGAGVGIALADDPDAKIEDITIFNRQDVDGDGYVSSFQLRVDADTDFPEVGGLGKANPVMEIVLHLEDGGSSVAKKAPVGRDRDGTFIFQIDGDEVFAQGGGDTDPIAVNPTFSVVEVRLLDADVLTHNSVTSLNQLLVSDPLKIERPSDDRYRDVTVTSNVDGADVFVDGERRGRTPWTGSFAVDHDNRYGNTLIEVREDGYETASKRVELDSPEVRLAMEKQTKPVAVTSEPDGATVYVDGQEVGTTPWIGEFWVRGSHTIRVEKSGYFGQEFTTVSHSRTIHASLLSSSLQLSNIDYLNTIYTNVTFDDSSDTNDSSTSQDETQVIDTGTLDSSPVVTGSSNVDFTEYLPRIVDSTSVIDAAISASTTSTPSEPLSSETVTFDASNSHSLFGSVDSYTWTFGDGTTDRGRRVTHSYDTPGTYDVELKIEDTEGNRDTVHDQITVEDRSPNAVFVSSHGTVETGQQVRFNGSSSFDPEGPITSYEWDFGDGTVRKGATQNHSYASAGDKDVTLTVTDASGTTAAVTRTLSVYIPNDPPSASFDVLNTDSGADLQVEFDASTSVDPDGELQAYGWEFGDGTNASGERVVHEFESPGTYTVELSVRDDRGDVRQTKKQIDVTSNSSSSNVAGESENPDGSGSVPVAPVVAVGAAVIFLGGLRLLRR